MSEFLPPRMHEAESDEGAHEQAPQPPLPFQPPPQAPVPAPPSEPPVPAPPASTPSESPVPAPPSEPSIAAPASVVNVPAEIPGPPVVAPAASARAKPWRPGPLGRLISLIITVGLAWALTVAITAWLLGLFLARG